MVTDHARQRGRWYHKLITPDFEGFIKRLIASKPAVVKSVTATLDFAAAMAQSSRLLPLFRMIIRTFRNVFCVSRSHLYGLKRIVMHFYKQNELNEKYDPDINTGMATFMRRDEFFWRPWSFTATEKNFAGRRSMHLQVRFSSSVGNVSALGTFTLVNALGFSGDVL